MKQRIANLNNVANFAIQRRRGISRTVRSGKLIITTIPRTISSLMAGRTFGLLCTADYKGGGILKSCLSEFTLSAVRLFI